MIKCVSAEVIRGSNYRWHRAKLEFVLDDEGYERLMSFMQIERVDVPGTEPALPAGPIDAEFIDE